MKKYYKNPKNDNLIIYEDGKVTELVPVESQEEEIEEEIVEPVVTSKPKKTRKKRIATGKTDDEIEGLLIVAKEDGLENACKKFNITVAGYNGLKYRYLKKYPEKADLVRPTRKPREPRAIKERISGEPKKEPTKVAEPPKETNSGGNKPLTYICLNEDSCGKSFFSRLDPNKGDDLSALRCPLCGTNDIGLK